ncbi:TVP38/TMEM64 family protein [Aliiroseovarius sp. PTFE2010]|uniref:TVP38/TMEM64 family protein n=1 Tax=Aliiroseovarius sp. PTFE2010 TaxID=3417190 RepID=UPI003CECFFE8
MNNNAQTSIWRHVPLFAIAIAAVLGAVLLRDTLSFDALRDNRQTLLAFRDSHYASAVAAFIGTYIVIVAFSLPGATVTTLTGGFLFGLFPGVVFNVIGASIGAVGIFLAARLGLGKTLAAKMDASDGLVRAIKRGIDDNQWSMLFFIRLVPLVPFFVANLIPALVGVSLWRFAVSTFFGIMPGALVYTSVGSGLGAVFERGETPDLGVIFEPYVLLPILGLCALSILPVLMKRFTNGDAV